MMEQGILTGRWELLDGEIVSKMGMNAAHRITLILVSAWLIGLFGKLRVQEQLPIRIETEDGLYNEPEPDVAVTLEPTTHYTPGHPGPSDLVLVVEISDSTLADDLETKAIVYGKAGIVEYWVFDVKNRKLFVHMFPGQNGYADVLEFDEEQPVACLAAPERFVRVGELLPPVETLAE
jgi:Uma2 family endonuclease